MKEATRREVEAVQGISTGVAVTVTEDEESCSGAWRHRMVAGGRGWMAKKKISLLLQKLKKYELPELPEPLHDPELFTPEQLHAYKKIGFKNKNYVPVGVRGVFGGVVLNMHMHWKFHETVQVCCDNFPKEKIREMASMLARLSGGIVINIHDVKTIIMFRGRNYRQPKVMTPINTLTKRKALFKARFEQALESQKLNVKKIEQQLRQMGVNPDDPMAMASIQKVASTFFNAIDKKRGTPYVFRGDEKLSLPEPEVGLSPPPADPSPDSDQEELDRFIAEIEETADKECAMEDAAEMEEFGRIRYLNRPDYGWSPRRYGIPSDEERDRGPSGREDSDSDYGGPGVTPRRPMGMMTGGGERRGRGRDRWRAESEGESESEGFEEPRRRQERRNLDRVTAEEKKIPESGEDSVDDERGRRSRRRMAAGEKRILEFDEYSFSDSDDELWQRPAGKKKIPESEKDSLSGRRTVSGGKVISESKKDFVSYGDDDELWRRPLDRMTAGDKGISVSGEDSYSDGGRRRLGRITRGGRKEIPESEEDFISDGDDDKLWRRPLNRMTAGEKRIPESEEDSFSESDGDELGRRPEGGMAVGRKQILESEEDSYSDNGELLRVTAGEKEILKSQKDSYSDTEDDLPISRPCGDQQILESEEDSDSDSDSGDGAPRIPGSRNRNRYAKIGGGSSSGTHGMSGVHGDVAASWQSDADDECDDDETYRMVDADYDSWDGGRWGREDLPNKVDKTEREKQRRRDEDWDSDE